ncbi:MAG: B12-binding domain-containing radical SAM protein [bacterium]
MKKKRILLVYPKIPPTYWSFKYALPFIRKKAAYPPIGLLTVAALLPDYYDIELIDMNVSSLEDDAIISSDLVMVSAMMVQKKAFSTITKRCNKMGVPIAAGGPYPTSSFKKIEGVNHFILNEAEVTMHEFIDDFEKGCARNVYMSEQKADITSSPPPRFDLINLNDYATMALQYSRGCPFNCEFCDIIELFGRKPRLKKNEQFIHELELLYDAGWRGALFVVDDNFIGNKKRVKGLLKDISLWQRDKKYPFNLFTEASIDLSEDKELLSLMAEAGFNMVFVGIETPDEDTLRKVNKQQNVRHKGLINNILEIKKYGIEVSGGFIVGFDTDTPDIFDRQIEFIQESGIPSAMVGLLTALPNTQLYRRLLKEGRLLKDSSGNNTHDLYLNFKPKMDIDMIINGYKKIISSIYDPMKYFERCLTFLRSVNPAPHSCRKVGLNELYYFFSSLVRQSFSAYGYYYIKFLMKALVIKPKMFPEAVRLAIVGHHLLKITKEILAVDAFKMYIEKIREFYLKKVTDFEKFDFEAHLRLKDSILLDLKKKYNKLHKDFRHLAEESFTSIEYLIESYSLHYMPSKSTR